MFKQTKTNIFVVFAFLLFSLVFFISSVPVYALSANDLVDNSFENPYIINTKQDFLDLTDLVNTGSNMQGKYFVLNVDLDFSAETFVPIGNGINNFAGHFDGNNHKISININTSALYSGVFGYLGSGAVVKNLVVDGSIIGHDFLGGIAGYNNGTIVSCINFATITAKDKETKNVGGIAGENMGKIDSCISVGNITANFYVGGIAGKNLSNNINNGILSCINLAKIAITNHENFIAERIGGLVGQSRGVIANSYNYAEINASGQRIGSLVGDLVSTPDGTQNVYNITEKNARSLVGHSSIVYSDKFFAKSIYDFLKNQVVFAQSTMKILDFEQGYGFLYYPQSLEISTQAVDKMRICLFGSGDGKELTPFVIDSLTHFQLFAVNSQLFGYSGVHILLNRSLAVGTIQPLFSTQTPFGGYFDGHDNTITLNISGTNNLGLFASVTGGEIKNLTINGKVEGSGQNIGALIAQANNVVLKDITNNCQVDGGSFVGGVVGLSSGGIDLENVTNLGAVKAVSKCGGIVGQAESAQLLSTSNYGQISAIDGSSNDGFGGIIGKITSVGIAEEVCNFGKVSARRATDVGGIFGYINNGALSKVANTNDVTGRTNVGGIIGRVQGTATLAYLVSDAMNISSVTGAENVAGFVGNMNSSGNKISDSYFSGRLLEVTEATIKPLTFYPLASQAVVENGYYNSDLVDKATSVGVGKSIIMLCDNLFGTNAWQIMGMEQSFGYYPLLNLPILTTNQTLISTKIVANFFGGGEGTVNSPYLINNEQSLQNFSYLINNYDGVYNYSAFSYKITENIALKRAFDTVEQYSGNFDGNGKTIDNLVINGADNLGFFQNLGANAVVSKLFIASGQISGTNNIGSIASTLASGGQIIDSFSNIKIVGTNNIGGLVGKNYGSIVQSFFGGKINGTENIGGIAGINEANATIRDCFSLGFIVGANVVGGIAGNNQGNIEVCQVSNTVHITANGYSGGVAGNNLIGNISYCYVIAILSKELSATTAKIGGLVGQYTNTGTATLTGSFYHSVITKAITPYYIETTPWAETASYTRTTEQMQAEPFLGALNYKYTGGIASTLDADFAPIINSFANSSIEIMNTYAKKSAKLPLFGWDNTSDFEWGTEQNPYIIATALQLDKLSKLVLNSKYSYINKYFVLANNINMQSISQFIPIGKYISSSSSENIVFNGVFDGKGYSIQNLVINRTDSYVALFGYTGSSFVLKNLTLDSSCAISSTNNYVASFVGYNGGKIDKCISYAVINGANYVGGLCANSAINTTITNCVFYGQIPTDIAHSYGVTGIIPTAGIAIDTTNTWYIFKNSSDTNIKTNALPYIHNEYGSVLYVDKLGSVLVNVDIDAAESKYILSIQMVANEHYTAAVMSNLDAIIYKGTMFLPYTYTSGEKRVYFVRFCQTAELDFVGLSQDFMTNVDSYGKGEYYEGQEVEFKISVQKDYYLVYLAEYITNGYEIRNVSNDIIIRFVMGKNNIAEAFYVPLQISYAKDLVQVDILGGNTYNAQSRQVDITLDSTFSSYTNSYYYGQNFDSVAEIKNAGDYVVYTYLYTQDSANVFLGIVQNSYAINPLSLVLNTTPIAIEQYWQAVVATKTYDGSNKLLNQIISSQYMDTIFAEDLAFVDIKADVYWASANASSDIFTTVKNFRLSSSMAVNYQIDSAIELSGILGSINKKQLTITIDSPYLTMQYTNSKPTITNFRQDGSLDTTLVWGFVKLGTDGLIDTDWANLVQKTYHVGNYLVSATAEEVDNYIINLADSYVFVITPKMVSNIVYYNYANKIYDGSDLSIGITATYETSSGFNFASLDFYEEGNAVMVAQVINAGSYFAVPVISSANYILDDTKDNNLYFVVAKSSSGGKITFSADTTNFQANEQREVTFTCDIFDAQVAVEIVGSSRAKIELNYQNGSYYLLATAYSTQAFSYRIVASGATNYTDRYSDLFSMEVAPLTIYVGIANRNHIFGDEIALDIQYSFDKIQNSIVDIAQVQQFAGFSPSYYQIEHQTVYNVGHYNVSIYGGDFDAYKIEIADTCFIDIAKRAMKIRVSTETKSNDKIYGETDRSINYLVIDMASEEQMSILPNGLSVVLYGNLGRSVGEAVGEYDINIGNMVASNPNYELVGEFVGTYKINRRPLQIQILDKQKYYLDSDPTISLGLVDCSFAFSDNFNNISVTATREIGEDVGQYHYSVVGHSGGQNYEITAINAGYLTILAAQITVNYSTQNTLYYGEKLNTLKISATANYKGSVVSGTVSWDSPNQVADTVGQKFVAVTFYPSNSNYANKNFNVPVVVNKRQIEVHFEGITDYTYNGKTQCDIVAMFTNLYNNETLTPVVSTDKSPINVGTYKFIADIVSDKYTIVNDNFINFYIHAKNVTVYVDDLTVLEGKKFDLLVKYDGFVEGEGKEDIDTLAVVENIPSKSGIYTITPQGAEAVNYTFSYKSATLIINQKTVVGSNLTISGEIPAGITANATSYYKQQLEFGLAADLLDKKAGGSIIMPSKNTLSQYISIEYNQKIVGNYTYSIKFDNEITSSDSIFVFDSQGNITALEDFDLSEDGLTITFSSTDVAFVAVYSPKTTVEYIKGFVPLAIAGVGAIIFVVVVVVIVLASKKREKARIAYLKSLDN